MFLATPGFEGAGVVEEVGKAVTSMFHYYNKLIDFMIFILYFDDFYIIILYINLKKKKK